MGVLGSKTNQAKRQWQNVNVDVDDLLKKVQDLQKELRRSYRREEPESSSAGFVAGVAVGALLGVVLSYLFGKQGGSEMVDQFAQRAEGLRESATEKYHQARNRAEGESDQAAASFGEGPAIEREFDDNGDDLGNAAEAVLERERVAAEESEKRSDNA